jgi:hypothetical protein
MSLDNLWGGLVASILARSHPSEARQAEATPSPCIFPLSYFGISGVPKRANP